jgi:dCMP deaminase
MPATGSSAPVDGRALIRSPIMISKSESQHSRPSWDDYFMGIALQVARRSTCDRARVGAIIVKDRRILTTGYNGSPAGLPHCDEIGHLMVNGHCVRTLHAEQNAIIQAALHGVGVADSTMYVTHQPCLTCAKMIINAGIRRVVYGGHYPDPHAVAFLKDAGVALEAHAIWGDAGESLSEDDGGKAGER